MALLKSFGLNGLAAEMQTRIADEPVTINNLTNRLLDLGGVPDFNLAKPNIGADLQGILRNDLDGQIKTRPYLNDLIDKVAKENDATTRILIENILNDEELHLSWLETEVSLFEKLGEALYTAHKL